MNDRGLLELAAKAAGVKLKFRALTNMPGCVETCFSVDERGISERWNPIERDGDAFQLAIRLRIDLTFYNGFQEVHAEPSNSDGLSPSDEKFGDDIASAARRAIVRAAAEIGRSMP